MIWYDMIWYDMIWYDMIWYHMIWYDMIWYDIIWYDMIWYHMIWYDMISYDMIWYDMIWYDMIWYDMIWYDMIWYDMIWYDNDILKISKNLWFFLDRWRNHFLQASDLSMILMLRVFSSITLLMEEEAKIIRPSLSKVIKNRYSKSCKSKNHFGT
jgi:hypothetical protein